MTTKWDIICIILLCLQQEKQVNGLLKPEEFTALPSNVVVFCNGSLGLLGLGRLQLALVGNFHD